MKTKKSNNINEAISKLLKTYPNGIYHVIYLDNTPTAHRISSNNVNALFELETIDEFKSSLINNPDYIDFATNQENILINNWWSGINKSFKDRIKIKNRKIKQKEAKRKLLELSQKEKQSAELQIDKKEKLFKELNLSAEQKEILRKISEL